jgi:hypothetical protein
MKPDDPDVISFGRPPPGKSHIAWPGAHRVGWIVVAFLSVGLAVAIIVAVHYHGQVVALHRQAHNAPRAAWSPTRSPTKTPPSRLTVSSTDVAFIAAGSLTGDVTFVAANPPGGLQTNIVIIAHVSGGRPHTRYTLTGGSCSGGPDHAWASGVTDAGGNGDLIGPVRRISQAANYWLELNPAVRSLHPSLAGDFASATDITAYRSGPPMCGT